MQASQWNEHVRENEQAIS